MILLSNPCFFSSFQDKFKEKLFLLDEGNIENQVRGANLIIFTGGEDLNPVRYGEKNLGSYYNNKRDFLEYELMTLAIRYKKSILGTCRGLQLINIFFGGTLHQDIAWKHSQINFNWGSNILKELFPHTNSLHHQGIKDLAPDFYSLGNTTDNLIESIFCPRLKCLGFQFHPELIKSPFWERIIKPELFYKELEDELCMIV
ncbi:MAG TPA: hypothetical protein DEG71_07260 [Clostridiales bacterium]|nr:hypothetical protein [Clostridiales bacterium]